MIDFVFIILSGFAGLIAGAIIIEVFRWGYNKENKK